MRGNEIPEGLPSGMASNNIYEAHFKSLRLYRKICRMMPFVLRIHELTFRVTGF